MKLIIAGSRKFNDYNKLRESVAPIVPLITEIVSGTAPGADRLGERFADEFNIPVKQFPADWDRYGKPAGYIRNKQMAEYADALIVFWDGKSPGTKHMIDAANSQRIKVAIIQF